MPVVDIHIHAIAPSLVGEVERGAFRGVSVERTDAGLSFRFPGMQPSPAAPPRLADFEALAVRGRRQGIDVQVVGPWTDLFGYTLPRQDAAAWSQAYNDAQTAACGAHPGLVPMAAVPMQYPELAAGVLIRASEAGCRGVMVGTDIPDIHLDSPALEPIWEAAAGLGMPIVVHPTFLTVPRRLQAHGLKNAVARIGEITIALSQLVYAGVLRRHPTLAVIGALGGGAIVPARRRLQRNHALGWSDSDVDVETELGRLYFDTVVLDPGLLRFLVAQMGGNQFLMGSDYPFPWEPDPVSLVRMADLPPDTTLDILGGTARRLFGLEAGPHACAGAPALPGEGAQ